MHTNLLINAIMQQTTVLIAHLSTAAGIRAPLSHIADQVFVELAAQIETQGVPRKVAADMFGLALRTYQKKVNRIVGSQHDASRTLWQSLLELLTDEGSATRRQILERFPLEDPQTLGALLSDLVNSGLVYRSGSGDVAVFGLIPEADLLKHRERARSEALLGMAWLRIYRQDGIRLSELHKALGISVEEAATVVQQLERQGRVQCSAEAEPLITAAQFVVPVGSSEGWEAAVFDHFQAACNAVAQKLSQGARRSEFKDEVGGTTLSFNVYPGHPFEARVRRLLSRVREETNALWDEVAQFNRDNPPPANASKVTFYAGQWVQEADE